MLPVEVCLLKMSNKRKRRLLTRAEERDEEEEPLARSSTTAATVDYTSIEARPNLTGMIIG